MSLPHHFAHAYFLAILHRPSCEGSSWADADLLGKLATPRGRADDRHRLLSRSYLELLGGQSLLRVGWPASADRPHRRHAS